MRFSCGERVKKAPRSEIEQEARKKTGLCLTPIRLFFHVALLTLGRATGFPSCLTEGGMARKGTAYGCGYGREGLRR